MGFHSESEPVAHGGAPEEPFEVPVTVAVPGVGAEDAVVNQDRWEQVRRWRAQGMSVSAIARAMDLDRKTVRRCLGQAQWQPYQRTVRPDRVIEPHRQWMFERAPQVGFSARILFQELRAQHGYAGSYATVRDAVRPWRAQAAAAD